MFKIDFSSIHYRRTKVKDQPNMTNETNNANSIESTERQYNEPNMISTEVPTFSLSAFDRTRSMRVRKKEYSSKCVFLDFDDTLFPSSLYHNTAIKLQKVYPTHDEFAREIDIDKLDILVGRYLDILFSITPNVAIVTSSTDGWVKLAMSMYYPKTIGKYPDLDIRQAPESVRSLDPKTQINTMTFNKYASFRNIIETKMNRELDFRTGVSYVSGSVVSIGDSMTEMNATTLIGNDFPSVCVSKILTAPKPTYCILQDQINLLMACSAHLLNAHTNMKDVFEDMSK
jgi:hypothetical protein